MLGLNETDKTCRNLMPALLTMQNLKIIYITGLEYVDQILPLLLELPELEKLTIRVKDQKYEEFVRARTYLRPTERTFVTEAQKNLFLRTR